MGGCASTASTRFVVSVDALSTPNAENMKSYVLIPGQEGVNADDLQFREYAEYLDRALAMRGFAKVDDIKQADMAILVGYAIGEPKEHVYSYSIPHFGQTGVSSSSTYGTVQSYGGGYGTYSGTTTYQPKYGITGYSSHVGTYTTFTRGLFLTAVDLKVYQETEKIRELWKVTAISTGISSDLRLVFPYLVTAAQPYLGQSTDKKAVKITLRENDKRVVEIREGIKQPNSPH